jgi:hypothetical protein
MEGILRTFFAEVAALRKRSPQIAASLRIDFIGTNYAPAARSQKLVLPIAAEFGLGDIVTEEAGRIPYFEALAAYAHSDAILLFGSDSADYVASKLFNCVAAKKPILAMFQERSFVAKIAGSFPNIKLATFAAQPDEKAFSAAVAEGLIWLKSGQSAHHDLGPLLKPWSAETLSAKQCQVFDSACAASSLS